MAWRCRFLNTRHTGGGRARRDGAHALLGRGAVADCVERQRGPPRHAIEQTSRRSGSARKRREILFLHRPLFAAAAAYAARRLRAQHASSLGDAFARQDGRAGAGADAAAFASYAAAAAHASSLRRHRAAAGWGVVLCAAPVLLFLRVPRKEGRRLPSLISSGSYERRHVTAAVNFVRGAAWVLAPTLWLALTALGRGAARVPLVLALAGPGAVAAAATRARHVVAAALVSWPLTLAPFFLRGATGDGLLLGALGCVGSAGVALFYEEPRGGWED